MALRRSGVRIPLGPQHNLRIRIRNTKVMAGVVGHSVSEKGRQGESPSTAPNGSAKHKDRTRLLSQTRDCAGESEKRSSQQRVARYSKRVVEVVERLPRQFGWYRGENSSSLMWMKGFFYFTDWRQA